MGEGEDEALPTNLVLYNETRHFVHDGLSTLMPLLGGSLYVLSTVSPQTT
jgi:hypothetical protein